jgi:16S rRNA (guanine527-N7)-methyltransferase
MAPDERTTDRPALPSDPATLEPMGVAFDALVTDGLRRLGVTLSPGATSAIEVHARLLVAWNTAINLTALRLPEQVALGHVLDSLSALPVIRERQPRVRGLLDLGSGGGYPGLPLACGLGVERACLVDSIGKKARFLAVAGEAAAHAMRRVDGSAPRIEARDQRAEELAASEERESWDVVTCRAVGSLAEVAELGLPLARVGGIVLAWKRDHGTDSLNREIRDARRLIREAGGTDPEMLGLPDPTLLPGHRLVVMAKAQPTPRWMPRPVTERRRALIR